MNEEGTPRSGLHDQRHRPRRAFITANQVTDSMGTSSTAAPPPDAPGASVDLAVRTAEKDPKKYSKAVSPQVSIQIKIHPACLAFGPTNINKVYPIFLRVLAREHFVVGTYELAEEKKRILKGVVENGQQERIGGLSLYRVYEGKLYWQQDLFREYGVYDIKFLPFHPIFAVSTTVGSIGIFCLEETAPVGMREKELRIKEIANHVLFDDNTIIISIAWYPLRDNKDTTFQLALTVETGGVYIVVFKDNFTSYTIKYNEKSLHEHVFKTPFFENPERVWSCAWAAPLPNAIFSGGDDNHLRMSTLICKGDIENTLDDPIDMKIKFPAGVTSILPLPITTLDKSHIVLVGCYDCHLRLCRIKNRSSGPEVIDYVDLDLGGGVYRLKFLESYDPVRDDMETTFKVLAACMHAGTKIILVRRGLTGWSVEILAEVMDNESMCYAADIQPLPSWEVEGNPGERGLEERTFVSSSWADSRLSVWTFNPKEVPKV